MRTLILTLALTLSTLLPAGAVKKIEANPINIAVMLTQEKDTASMASTCDYYGYVRQIPQDGYTVFRHANGSVIRYKYLDADQKYPTIEVKSKASQKEKEETLKHLNFQKNGNSFERRSVGYTTRCIFGPRNFIVLTNYSKLRQ